MIRFSLFDKSVAATVVLGLAFVQLAVMGLARGWFGNLSIPARRRLVRWHRYEGYLVLGLILLVAYECIFVIKPHFRPLRASFHMFFGVSVLGLAAAKVAIRRFVPNHYNNLKALGLTLFGAIVLLWLVSAGWYWLQSGTGLLRGY